MPKAREGQPAAIAGIVRPRVRERKAYAHQLQVPKVAGVGIQRRAQIANDRCVGDTGFLIQLTQRRRLNRFGRFNGALDQLHASQRMPKHQDLCCRT